MAGAVLVLAGAACSLVNAPDDPLAADGGNGAGASNTGGDATGGGTNSECEVVSDCPGSDTSCRTRRCEDGACAVDNAGVDTPCSESSCIDGAEAGGSTCDGNGNCVGGTPVPCDPYTCDADALVCLASCGGNADCATGNVCVTGACVPPQIDGATCTADDQCQSGFCPPQDGVCCDTACSGTCESCVAVDTGAQDGACAPVLANTDPDNECSGLLCDGTGSCACAPTGVRAPFNTQVSSDAANCFTDNPCADDTYVWASPFGAMFSAVGQQVTCGGAPTCVANVGVATYESVGNCQGVWDVYCDGAHLGVLSTVNQACAGTAMTNGCNISFSPRVCSQIRLEAQSGGPGACCGTGTPDSAIVAVSAW